jgi:glycosyltransferase involved in cell wall biosynthesis
MPFFTVIIPVYNKEAHIQRCINSVIGQTYNDFEIIVINDASTDDSIKKIKEIYDRRIVLLERDNPGAGGYAARNIGIKYSNGEWITFIDADDEWMENHLSRLYNIINKYNNICFISSGYIIDSKNRSSYDAYYKYHKNKKDHIIRYDKFIKNFIKSRSPICTDVACIKNNKEIIKDIFPEKINVKRGGDNYVWIKLICYYKEMLWSDHLGAIYHRDSDNMVTKNAQWSYRLMSKEVYDDLARKLNKREKKLLSEYMNHRLYHAWKGNYDNDRENFILFNKLYWKQDFIRSLFYSIVSIVPNKMLKSLFYIKRTIGKKYIYK